MSSTPDQIDLPAINQMLESSEPSQIVQWAVAQFAPEIVMSSSFGAESALLLHMASRALPRMRVIMVDPGYLFPETHQFTEQLRQRLDLNILVYRSKNDPDAYLRSANEDDPTWRTNVEACCAVNKNEPFDRAMRELTPRAWLRGIRRNQADTRRSRQIVEWSGRFNCYALSPILNWTGREIPQYMKQHDLPYHPLYEKGYASIGCSPSSCTRPIMPGEDPRAGRWSGQAKTECGLHLSDLPETK
jgi:phosphoadenosine phosphosulfate reductase